MSDQEEYDDYGMDVDPSSQANTNENDDDSATENVSDDGEEDSSDDDSDVEVKLYEKYAQLLGAISSETYVYDNYVELVSVAQ